MRIEKVLSVSLVLSVAGLCAGQGFDGGGFGGGSSATSTSPVVVKNDMGTKGTYRPTADSDAARGAALTLAVAAAASGDVIKLGPGNYTPADTLALPEGVELCGAGRTTVITADTTGWGDPTVMTCAGTNYIHDLSVINTMANHGLGVLLNDNCRLYRCYVQALEACIELYGDNNDVDSCEFYVVGGMEIISNNVQSTKVHHLVRNCYIHGTLGGPPGLSIAAPISHGTSSPSDLTLINNRIEVVGVASTVPIGYVKTGGSSESTILSINNSVRINGNNNVCFGLGYPVAATKKHSIISVNDHFELSGTGNVYGAYLGATLPTRVNNSLRVVGGNLLSYPVYGAWKQGVDALISGAQFTVPESIVFTGSGLDDATVAGQGTSGRKYRVQIDTEGTPDTFKWSLDNGLTWEATGLPVSDSATIINEGITVLWAATTGHTAGDYWDFYLKPTGATTLGAGLKAGTAALRFGRSPTEGLEIKVVDEDVKIAAAVSADLTADVPTGAVILSVQANLETAVTQSGGGSNNFDHLAIGVAGALTKYGEFAANTKNAKLDKMPDWAVLSGAEDVQIYGVQADGTTAATETVTATVRVRIVYAVLNSLDDAM